MEKACVCNVYMHGLPVSVQTENLYAQKEMKPRGFAEGFPHVGTVKAVRWAQIQRWYQ